MRFPGQYAEAGVGVSYNGHRYYDPGIGRYVSADPIGQRSDPNVYTYAYNNPLRWIDPLGLDVRITIQRSGYTYQSVSSTVHVEADYSPNTFDGYAVEDSLNDDPALRNSSELPIPPGEYDAFVRTDHSPYRVELRDVPGYENIQLHIGNTPDDVDGCFGIGTDLHGDDAVSGSRTANELIEEIINEDGTGNVSVTIIGPSSF